MSSLQRSPLSPLVRKHAQNLKPKWLAVTETAAQLTKRFLDFSAEYRDAYQEIKTKLSDADVKRLNAEVGLNDAAATRLRQIAEAKPLLHHHVKQLPASFEALHAVAVFATEKRDKFRAALKDGTITPDLTVREARLLQPPRRASTKRNTATPSEFRVELFFDSRESLIDTVAALIGDSVQARVSDPHLRDGIKEKIGKTRWASVEAQLRR